jgi:hypothetical protein
MITRVMNTNFKRNINNTTSTINDDTITINGMEYRRINKLNINMAKTIYHISNINTDNANYALVDRGANGGLFGNDVKIINQTQRRVTITGIANHQVGDLPICTGAAFTVTHRGPVILIMHQYAYFGQGKTINASGQLEFFKNTVDEKSRIVGGKQCISTTDGYFIPLKIIQGLAYFSMRPPTDKEMDLSLIHI